MRERDRDSVTNLHIPSEAFFFKMFLTHYVLLGIFMFYVQIFYSQIINPLFTQLSDFLWIRYCKGAYSLATFHSAKFGFALRHYFSRGATVQCCVAVCVVTPEQFISDHSKDKWLNSCGK